MSEFPMEGEVMERYEVPAGEQQEWHQWSPWGHVST